MSVTGDETLASQGFTTTDGWLVTFRRFLVVPGEVKLEGDDCDQYSENDYTRVLDVTFPGSQRLALVYGLGACDFAFRLSVPSQDSVPGVGVRDGDIVALRTPGDDPHAEHAGVSVWVDGSAEKLGVTKRFSWPFRRYIQYERCSAGERESFERGLRLSGGGASAVDLSVRGDALFSAPDSSTAFEPFRAADEDHGDADGDITLDELESVPWTGESEPGAPAWSTLGERVYLGLLPNIVRYRATGSCDVHSSADEPDDGGF